MLLCTLTVYSEAVYLILDYCVRSDCCNPPPPPPPHATMIFTRGADSAVAVVTPEKVTSCVLPRQIVNVSIFLTLQMVAPRNLDELTAGCLDWDEMATAAAVEWIPIRARLAAGGTTAAWARALLATPRMREAGRELLLLYMVCCSGGGGVIKY